MARFFLKILTFLLNICFNRWFWVIWLGGMYAVAFVGVVGRTDSKATAGKMAKTVEDKKYSCEKHGENNPD
jgi:hypothetical protein